MAAQRNQRISRLHNVISGRIEYHLFVRPFNGGDHHIIFRMDLGLFQGTANERGVLFELNLLYLESQFLGHSGQFDEICYGWF